MQVVDASFGTWAKSTITTFWLIRCIKTLFFRAFRGGCRRRPVSPIQSFGIVVPFAGKPCKRYAFEVSFVVSRTRLF